MMTCPGARPLGIMSDMYLCAWRRAQMLDDGELLSAWDGLGCSSTPDELAGALHLLGREVLAEDEEANIGELRALHAAVWEEIVARGLVHRTPPESRYEDDLGDGVAEMVERRTDLALVG